MWTVCKHACKEITCMFVAHSRTLLHVWFVVWNVVEQDTHDQTCTCKCSCGLLVV